MSDFAFPVDATNAEQAGDWDGADGEYWATHHQEYERLLGVFTDTLVEAADVRTDDRCLDIGCGTGATTRALAARATQGATLGLDLSGPMLAIAREGARSAGLDHVDFVQGDAQVYPFDPGSFDLAVSRMGCMFFGDPAAAFANIGRALGPGGRVAFVVWQTPTANDWITAIDGALGDLPIGEDGDEGSGYAPGPFSLADPGRCAALLTGAGFVDVSVDALHLPLPFGAVADGQAFLETWIDEDLDDDARARATTALHRLLVDSATDGGVHLSSATWLLTARRPGEVSGTRDDPGLAVDEPTERAAQGDARHVRR